MQGKIYIHKNKLNGKCYVGQTITSVKRRWANGTRYKKQTKFGMAITKYGWDNFEHIVLPTIYTNQQELNNAEVEMIKELDSFNNGYNMTTGGDSAIISQEVIEKIRKGNLGKKLSKETKEKIVKKTTGSKRSKETKKLMSEKQKGKTHTEETKKKLSKLMTEERKKQLYEARKHLYGPLSKETKDKIRKSTFGKKLSKETKEKISKARKGVKIKLKPLPIKQMDKNGNLIRVWQRPKDAEHELNIFHIKDCCENKRKSAGNYIWEYL